MPAVGPRPSGCRVEYLEATDSTNSAAMRQVVAGERGPKWIVAAEQSAGRGRAGRRWVSIRGNLHASLIYALDCKPEHLPNLSLVAGLGLFDAVKSTTVGAGGLPGLRLKWPNDLVLAGAKIGGVLIESTRIGTETVAVIGIGLNVVKAPLIEGRRTASLADFGVECTAVQMVEPLGRHVGLWRDVWQDGAGNSEVISQWIGRAGPVGEGLEVAAGGDVVRGRFAGLDASGALLVEVEDGGVRRFTFGDVNLAADTC